ncbi:MAG: phenylalanine--tRNA ligase subunit beta [Pyrinomonadaceae bacterium]
MNLSYNWLKDLISVNGSPDELARVLTNAGNAVEGVLPVGDDFVLDLDLTSNRPDCLSHLGIARELSAITGRELKLARPTPAVDEVPMPAILANDVVKIEAPELCHRFTARIIRSVKIGPSPEWLVKRLEAVGERSINNVADITNYVMLELGQPMHAFDLDKLAENRIVVRRAHAGETITTLDEVERKLDDSMLAICDAERPVAVAGVMGGLHSGITDKTTNVLLEVAYFKRESIRQTSRKLGLATEASYRFERGVDIENLIRASNRATELICELAGGEAADIIDIYPTPRVPIEITSNDISSATRRLTGLEVAPAECERILTALGIDTAVAPRYVAPSWRHDLAIEEDLVEEVARIAGYDKIADELPPAFGAGEYQPTEPRKKLLRRTLADLGFDEAISYSFIDTRFDGMIDLLPGVNASHEENAFVTLRDSVIEGATRMRPSLVPGLLEAVRLNFNYQRRDLKLFELGRVFAGGRTEDGLPHEREHLAMVLTGGEIGEGRTLAARVLDFYDAKGAVESALEAVGAAVCSFETATAKHLRRGQTAAITAAGRTVGLLGRLGDDIAVEYKYRQPVFVAEIDLQSLLALPGSNVAYRPLPKFPAVTRDISLLGPRAVAFADIRRVAAGLGFELVRKVEFVDSFEGKGVEPGMRSITIRLEYRSDERTLVESEVEDLNKQIVGALERELGVRQRF